MGVTAIEATKGRIEGLVCIVVVVTCRIKTKERGESQ